MVAASCHTNSSQSWIVLFKVSGILLVDLIGDNEDCVLNGEEILEVDHWLVHQSGLSYFVNFQQFNDVVDNEL